jgi:hypothetical protein
MQPEQHLVSGRQGIIMVPLHPTVLAGFWGTLSGQCQRQSLFAVRNLGGGPFQSRLRYVIVHRGPMLRGLGYSSCPPSGKRLRSYNPTSTAARDKLPRAPRRSSSRFRANVKTSCRYTCTRPSAVCDGTAPARSKLRKYVGGTPTISAARSMLTVSSSESTD